MLVVDRVRRSFGAVAAVRDVSFTCVPGSVLGLLGPNGAGKTTTMRMILGIYPPDSGSITWNGKRIDPELRRAFGYLPEERGLYAKMRVREQIEYFGRLHGLDERAARAAQRSVDRRARARRVREAKLQRAFERQPAKGAAGLRGRPRSGAPRSSTSPSPVSTRSTRKSCSIRSAKLAEGGTTLLLSSHQMWQIENLCREFCIVAAGEVRMRGTLEQLRSAFPTRTVKVAPALPAIRAAFAGFGAGEPLAEDGALTYVMPSGTDFGALLRAAVAAGPVSDFERREPSLNEIYVHALDTRGRKMNEIGIVFAAEFARKLRSRVYLLATLGGALMVAFLIEAPALFSHVSLLSTSDVVLAGPAALRQRAAALMQARRDFRVVASLDALPKPVTLAFLDANHKAAAAIELSVRGGQLHLDVYPRDLAAYDDIEFRVLLPLSLEVSTGLSSAKVEPALRDRPHDPSARPQVRGCQERHVRARRRLRADLHPVFLNHHREPERDGLGGRREDEPHRGTAGRDDFAGQPADGEDASPRLRLRCCKSASGSWSRSFCFRRRLPALARPQSSLGSSAGAQLLAFDPGELAAFALFFVLGYFQYATIYAAAASLISRTEDLGSVATPVILPVVAAFFVAQYALLQPNAPFAVAFSFVPFVSPFVIFSRIAVSLVPWWQIALAVAVNVATVALCFFLAGKVYRVGMLLYGNAPSLRQVWAALRA